MPSQCGHSGVDTEMRHLREMLVSQQRTIDMLHRRVLMLENSLLAQNTTASCARAPGQDPGPSSVLSQPPSMETSERRTAPLLDLGTSATGGTGETDHAREAEERSGLHDLVVGCALDYLNTQREDNDGIWCENCDRPCAGECTNGEALLRLETETINVEGVPVPLESVLESPARERLRGTTTRGQWCAGCDRNAVDCDHLHRAPNAVDHVMVEGTPIPVSALQRNRAVELLLTHPLRDGAWCGDSEATHDVTVCYRVHKRTAKSPATDSATKDSATTECVMVGGRSVPIDELRHNPAVEYLMRNPSKRGRWCVASECHDPDDCNFVHPRSPVPPAPVDEVAVPKVNVGGSLVPVSRLAPNNAVEYLLEHPNRRGRWCNGHGKKTIQECTFVHTKHEEDVVDRKGASPPPAGAGVQRTKRMVVYYEADGKVGAEPERPATPGPVDGEAAV
uniref:Uncharacterized protein n=1 Tax=Neobodo designis TaxID=312471 RepID=A0A7S1QFV2_NEODS|mmetsp:Transcript_41809/g.129172  ORF Transcript_41809/g.129172 Transcript_41809/m.129172 type:complete len:450 (+) Transcript_41809:33-1382(+)|eukprot:CAMPEP_0174852416 /NCGR_PEP_ID=MMETSP1114-20130205/25355_1 /TAXON_ID=312471 /ORGANISM="Neobodo designis, Strain CCAP 1951/1" /LENGTH=449 /DNA_ID=CAMNT_0016087007 /DNA_START=30 /DNA_END=1379 /DNA_ORIENTATION=+